MELWIGIGNAVVVAAVGLVVSWLAKGRFDSLDRRIDRLEGRLDARVDGVDGRIDRIEDRLEATRSELHAAIENLRSDVTAIALVVGARPRAENG